MIAYTQSGKKLELISLGKAGGEGAVYSIKGYPNRVVKIYKNKAEAKLREEKITEMIKISNTKKFQSVSIKDDIAWPMAPIYDKSGDFIGFGMTSIKSSIDLEDLYVYPPDPTRSKPVSIYDRVTSLISLCEVINKVHSINQVVGDENPNNIKITSSYEAKLLDVDSYHILSDGRQYKCTVCAPGYVAPELIKKCKGKTYEETPGETFTPYTDRFALAIHIFRMLMHGAHPYTSKLIKNKVGSTPAPKPIDRKVEKGVIVYFSNNTGMEPPPYVPDFKALPDYIRDLFRRAFVDGSSSPESRPSELEWKSALEKFRSELVRCKNNKNHYHHKSCHSCPYCEADKRYIDSKNPFKPKKTNDITTKNTYSPKQVVQTSPIQQYASNGIKTIKHTSFMSSNLAFWIFTIIFAIISLSLLGTLVLPGMYNAIANNSTVTYIGVIGGIISGLVGSILYNTLWSFGAKRGYYDCFDYILSLLTCVAFTFGFGLVMGLLYIAVYLLIICIILAFIGAILGG